MSCAVYARKYISRATEIFIFLGVCPWGLLLTSMDPVAIREGCVAVVARSALVVEDVVARWGGLPELAGRAGITRPRWPNTRQHALALDSHHRPPDHRH